MISNPTWVFTQQDAIDAKESYRRQWKLAPAVAGAEPRDSCDSDVAECEYLENYQTPPTDTEAPEEERYLPKYVAVPEMEPETGTFGETAASPPNTSQNSQIVRRRWGRRKRSDADGEEEPKHENQAPCIQDVAPPCTPPDPPPVSKLPPPAQTATDEKDQQDVARSECSCVQSTSLSDIVVVSTAAAEPSQGEQDTDVIGTAAPVAMDQAEAKTLAQDTSHTACTQQDVRVPVLGTAPVQQSCGVNPQPVAKQPLLLPSKTIPESPTAQNSQTAEAAQAQASTRSVENGFVPPAWSKWHTSALTAGNLSEDGHVFARTIAGPLKNHANGMRLSSLCMLYEQNLRVGGVHLYKYRILGGTVGAADGVGFVFDFRIRRTNIQRMRSVFLNRHGQVCMRNLDKITKWPCSLQKLSEGVSVSLAIDLGRATASFRMDDTCGKPCGSADVSFAALFTEPNEGETGTVNVNVAAIPRSGFFCAIVTGGITVSLY